ncbi:MAG: alpha/beta hydrolase [Actinomycetota bacterium]
MTAVGQPITLEAGGRRFSASRTGPANGPVVLCLHGFPDSPDTFRHQVGPLADAGYQVIVPTLRGYEPSSQPADGDYSLITMAGDVTGWLDHLDAPAAHLVGHDWGAAIAYTAGTAHPERLRSITAIAIPPLTRIPDAVRRVPKQLILSWYMTFFQLRLVAERAVSANDWWLIRRLWRRWSPGYAMSATEWRDLRQRFEQPGVLGASLGYYRRNATPPILLGLRTTEAMSRHEIPVPTLIIHGDADGCMDRRLFDHTIEPADFPAGVQRVELPGAGHFVHLEQPDRVTRHLLEHLEHPDGTP